MTKTIRLAVIGLGEIGTQFARQARLIAAARDARLRAGSRCRHDR